MAKAFQISLADKPIGDQVEPDWDIYRVTASTHHYQQWDLIPSKYYAQQGRQAEREGLHYFDLFSPIINSTKGSLHNKGKNSVPHTKLLGTVPSLLRGKK